MSKPFHEEVFNGRYQLLGSFDPMGAYVFSVFDLEDRHSDNNSPKLLRYNKDLSVVLEGLEYPKKEPVKSSQIFHKGTGMLFFVRYSDNEYVVRKPAAPKFFFNVNPDDCIVI